jgi:hypothetical protein
MIKATRANFFRQLCLLFSLLLLCCLVACGGSTDTGTGTGTNTTTTDKSSITVTTDANYVVWGGTLTATATLRDASGNLLPNWVVTFATSSTLATFNPIAATALTNASGQASIQVSPAAIDSAGALNITASAVITVDGADKTLTSTPVGISVGGAAVTLDSIVLGSNSISAYGTTSVTVTVSPSTASIPVNFTSTCSGATITTPINTIGGKAISTYKDNGCSGTVTIYGAVTGTGAISTNLTVAPIVANNIKFISADPSIIGTSAASASSLSHSSVVKFQVVDNKGIGVDGIPVDFTLVPDNTSLGITLSNDSDTSSGGGYVTTSVNSGTVPTPVWVVAKLHSNSAILSQSNTLSITTGLPTQDHFSLSISTYNIEGLHDDGTTSTLTIIASDRLSNPIPEGTVINFVAEKGIQIPATCSIASGTCTVTFKSSGARPTDGRVSILAYALGEESFVDANGNNIYDHGETFTDLGDPFVDNNENGSYDSGEQYFHYGLGTAYTTGDGVWGQNYVRRNTVIVLSGRVATITPTTLPMGSTCLNYLPFKMYDENTNPMPAGTTVTVSDSAVYYTPYTTGTPTPATAEASIPVGSPVISTNAALGIGTTVVLKVKADCSAGTPTVYPHGTVELTIVTPNGYKTIQLVTVN